MQKNKISPAVVRRLPKYLRHLKNLEDDGVEKISSKQLSEITGFTASQIRQDLNHFGGFGQQGYGYRIIELKNSIIEIIGLDKAYDVVIVGYGHIGKAINKYNKFETKEFNVKAVFDLPEKERKDEKVEVRPIGELEEFLENNNVDIVVITVPKENAQEVCDKLADKDIKGVWNFAPIDVKVEGNIPVENIHLSESLYSLIFYMGSPEHYPGNN